MLDTVTSDVVSTTLPANLFLLHGRSNPLPQGLWICVGLPDRDQQITQLRNRKRLVQHREHIQHPVVSALQLIELNLPVTARLGQQHLHVPGLFSRQLVAGSRPDTVKPIF
jgi:hypothetical protein